MNNDLARATSPEEKELAEKRAELDVVSGLLAEKELELEELRLTVGRFQHRYFSEVGSKYAELDELHAQIAEARARNRRNDQQAQETAAKARDKARRTAADYECFDNPGDFVPKTSDVSENIKKLYRKIALIIHPDKATDDGSRDVRTRLMAKLNEAYAEGDDERMKDILSEFQSSPDTVAGEGTGADLVRVIRTIAQVRHRISEIAKEIAQIKVSDICQLMIEVQKATEGGRDVLREMAKAAGRDIDEARRELGQVG